MTIPIMLEQTIIEPRGGIDIRVLLVTAILSSSSGRARACSRDLTYLSPFLSFCLFLSVCPSVYLSLSFYLCLSLSVCLSVCLSACLSVFLSVCLFVYLSLFLSLSLSLSLSFSLSLPLSISLFLVLYPSTYLYISFPLCMWFRPTSLRGISLSNYKDFKHCPRPFHVQLSH